MTLWAHQLSSGSRIFLPPSYYVTHRAWCPLTCLPTGCSIWSFLFTWCGQNTNLIYLPHSFLAVFILFLKSPFLSQEDPLYLKSCGFQSCCFWCGLQEVILEFINAASISCSLYMSAVSTSVFLEVMRCLWLIGRRLAIKDRNRCRQADSSSIAGCVSTIQSDSFQISSGWLLFMTHCWHWSLSSVLPSPGRL